MANPSGFLVIWRHGMDDVPISFHATEAEAVKAAETTLITEGYTTAAILGIDCSTPVCFAVVEFQDGVPTRMFVTPRHDDNL